MDDLFASEHGLADALDENAGFQLLARALPDAVLVLRPGGRVAYASVQSCEVFGRAAGEIVGRPFLDLVAPDDRDVFPAPITGTTVGTWDFRVAGRDRWLNAAFLPSGLQGFRQTALHDALKDCALVLVRDVAPEGDVARDRTDLLRRALDATNNLIVVTDAQAEDNPVVLVNEHFLEVTGYTREDVLGQNCRFLQVRPDGTRDDDQVGVRQLAAAVAAGKPAHVILRNYRKDGALFYNELFVTPVHGPDGRVAHFVGVQNDVTERVQAERKALRQTSLLQAFFDSAPVLMGVVQRDAAGIVHRAANEMAAELYGAAPSAVPGLRPEEFGFTEAEARRWREAIEQCAETGEAVRFETVHPWGSEPNDHGVRILHMTVSRVEAQDTTDQGELYSYLGEDVTLSRKAERERKLLVAAIEQAAEPIVITGPELDAPGPEILYANRSHAETFGYEVGELVGESPRLFQGPKTDRAVLDRVREKLEAGEPVEAETLNYRKDGSEFILQWEIAPVRDETGEIVNWVGTQRDVTERRQLERDLLEISAREQERMARDLHDGLGQILTGAAYKLEALRGALAQAGDDRLAADADRSRQLVEDALGQARAIARGLFPVNIEPDGLMVALERLAADAAETYGAAITFEFDAPVLVTSEQAGHLYRIAQEALTNAVRHGRARAVALALSHGDEAVTLSIQDDGTGIPAEALTGDRGLGLRTMRYRAERVDGALDIRRLDTGGTLVAVTFLPASETTSDGARPDAADGEE